MSGHQESTTETVPATENNSARPSSAVGTLECRDEESAAGDLGTDAYRVGLREDLLSTLSSIQTSGSFASFGVLPQLPPVDLFVDDVGDIFLPLSEFQACQLIAKARQAPYSKGSATIVDTTFTFRNPYWPGFIRDLCTRVALDLGINAPITAQIYKMLINEKGAMFKAHTDTEKIPGMFGTLVVCLPSTHQGGEVVLKHCGEKKVFRTSEVSQSFASWYSDVSHEVLPVTSGFRWVLTYNLALDLTGPGPSASLQRVETLALRRTLKQWLSVAGVSRERNCVYHVLDYDYTEANISLKAELAVDVFLALLEKEEMGSCESNTWDRSYAKYNYYDYGDVESHYYCLDEVFEMKYAVKTLVDLEGHVVTQGLHLNEDDILQENCFENLEAEEEYEGSGIWPEHQAWNNCDKTTNSFSAQEPSIDGDGIGDVLAADHDLGLLPLDFFNIHCHFLIPDQFRAITNFVPIPNDSLASDTGATPDYVLDWPREKLRFCLDACASNVAPRIDQRHDAAAFFLAFLVRLRQQSTKSILPMKNTMQLYQTKARSFITLSDFTQFHSDARVQATPIKRASYGGQAQRFDRRTAISYEVLADFFSATVQSSTEADDLVAPFVSKLVANAYQLLAVEFHALWLPFLRCLIPILASNAITLDTPYMYVGHEPTEDRNLVRRGVDCSCSDCEVDFFAVNKQRRGHLHRGLDFCGVDLVTKTFQHNKKMRLDWKPRLMLAEGQIRQFEQGHLSLLLGPNYATIVNMAHLSAAELAQGQSPPVVSASPRTTTQPRQPLQAISSMAGVKRKFSFTETDIIDLTRE
ncbi:hypothetical protein GGI43DRAFT_426518 [Trichoderma evansii]